MRCGQPHHSWKRQGFALIFVLLLLCSCAALAAPTDCEHQWVKGKYIAPACEEEGQQAFECSLCHASKVDILEPLGHAWAEEPSEVAPPGCTLDGQSLHPCTRENCGTKLQRMIGAPGHDWQETEVLVAPDCTTSGRSLFTCMRCKETKEDVVPATDHCFPQEPSVHIAATCEEDGKDTFACERCPYSYDILLPKLGHDMNVVEFVAATCEADGYEKKACSRCEKTETTVLNALGHQMTVVEAVAPTCEADGYEVLKCSHEGCDKTETHTLTALGHDLRIVFRKMPYPGEDGYNRFECFHDNCDYFLETPNHSCTVEYVDPTCEQPGYKEWTCVNCGYVERKNEQEALGHQVSVAETVRPTCTKAGKVYSLCTVCGDEVVLEVLPALGHVYKNPYVQAETEHRIYCLRDCGKYMTHPCTMKQVQLGDFMVDVCAECGRGEVIGSEQIISKTTMTGIKKAKLEVLKTARVLPLDVTIQQFTNDEKLAFKLLTLQLKNPGMAYKLEGLCRVSIPYAADAQNMKLVFITEDGELVDVAYELIDGELVFETEALGTFAFIPVEEAA